MRDITRTVRRTRHRRVGHVRAACRRVRGFRDGSALRADGQRGEVPRRMVDGPSGRMGGRTRPPVSDEEELRSSLQALAVDVRESLPTEYGGTLGRRRCSLIAAHLEFYMLDPAFAELLDLVRPTRHVDVREAYSRHIMRLVDAIESTARPHRALSHFLARALLPCAARSAAPEQARHARSAHRALQPAWVLRLRRSTGSRMRRATVTHCR